MKSKAAQLAVLAISPVFGQEALQPPKAQTSDLVLVRDEYVVKSMRYIGFTRNDAGLYSYFILNGNKKTVVGIRDDFMFSQGDRALETPMTQDRRGLPNMRLGYANDIARKQGLGELENARAILKAHYQVAPY